MKIFVRSVQCSKFINQYAADTSGCTFVLSLFLLCWSPLVLAACMGVLLCSMHSLLIDCTVDRLQ